ncbi:ABC transporter substrate-binding protein [Streptomyces pactum]|uniref:ABC transporter substrate-binding protein n=1 Tax=Streptomyces pactum TaxID=68249 RepID=A0ABS0NNI6_9ACTN|nr:ABC transporter substrate-binding protein [Streptomyces pactum]MBH5336761.1 ABC transporter substrate-binding protein [Streptomyces pactum]
MIAALSAAGLVAGGGALAWTLWPDGAGGSGDREGGGDGSTAGDKPGGNRQPATDPAPSRTPTHAATPSEALPKEIRDRGVLTIGSDLTYPPMEFRRGGEVAGVDIDLGKALGRELGIRVEFRNSVFDSLLAGLAAGRHDLVMSAMADTQERREGRVDGVRTGAGVDFVDYFSAGLAVVVRKGNPEGVGGPEDLSGRTVTVQRGTVAHDYLDRLNRRRSKKVTIRETDTTAEAYGDVAAGRSSACLGEFPVAAHAAATRSGGTALEIVGDQVERLTYGIAVAKAETALRDAVAAALDRLIANGEYARVLRRWAVEDGALEKATVNGGR